MQPRSFGMLHGRIIVCFAIIPFFTQDLLHVLNLEASSGFCCARPDSSSCSDWFTLRPATASRMRPFTVVSWPREVGGSVRSSSGMAILGDHLTVQVNAIDDFRRSFSWIQRKTIWERERCSWRSHIEQWYRRIVFPAVLTAERRRDNGLPKEWDRQHHQPGPDTNVSEFSFIFLQEARKG